MKQPFNILAIETSCDETSTAIIQDGRRVLSSIVSSQIELHQQYGGVVPEIASRQHMKMMLPVIGEAMRVAGTPWEAIDAVAVTKGPGLAGALLVGVNTAKALAFARDLPLIGVNHMEAHIYGNWLIPQVGELRAINDTIAGARGAAIDAMVEPEFPLLCLIVSGGHTELVMARDHGDYALVGQTRDDAAGEAFDKVARLLGLTYPGGPSIQRAAQGGDEAAFALPRGMRGPGFEFSFSGLKTSVARKLETQHEVVLADMAASFEQAVADVLSDKAVHAATKYGARQIALAGGVAANLRLRRLLCERSPVPVRIPPLRFCTDNAAMVGSAAYYNLRSGKTSDLTLDVEPNLRLATLPVE